MIIFTSNLTAVQSLDGPMDNPTGRFNLMNSTASYLHILDCRLVVVQLCIGVVLDTV